MSDQAEKLRQLVIDALPRVETGGAFAPTIVVTGGKSGVGATTVAVNLAGELAQSGRRTVLVDAAARADAGRMLGLEIERGASLDDVLIGACSIADALKSGPAGISLLGGNWTEAAAFDRSPRVVERLAEELHTLGPQVKALVIDSGSGITSWTRRLWEMADLVLVVTTQDDAAVMETYATIKLGIGSAKGGRNVSDVRVLVNQASDAEAASDVQDRIASSSERFLGRVLARAPWLPLHFQSLNDALFAETSDGSESLLAWELPATMFGRAAHQLGRFAADVISHCAHTPRVSCEPSSC
jgi:MinD-like ATPase involved in chromosome partitioning or flagellar assembly